MNLKSRHLWATALFASMVTTAQPWPTIRQLSHGTSMVVSRPQKSLLRTQKICDLIFGDFDVLVLQEVISSEQVAAIAEKLVWRIGQ